MNVQWLLETDTFEEDIDKIAAEIKTQGFEYKMVQYIPFESGKYDDLFKDSADDIANGCDQTWVVRLEKNKYFSMDYKNTNNLDAIFKTIIGE